MKKLNSTRSFPFFGPFILGLSLTALAALSGCATLPSQPPAPPPAPQEAPKATTRPLIQQDSSKLSFLSPVNAMNFIPLEIEDVPGSKNQNYMKIRMYVTLAKQNLGEAINLGVLDSSAFMMDASKAYDLEAELDIGVGPNGERNYGDDRLVIASTDGLISYARLDQLPLVRLRDMADGREYIALIPVRPEEEAIFGGPIVGEVGPVPNKNGKIKNDIARLANEILPTVRDRLQVQYALYLVEKTGNALLKDIQTVDPSAVRPEPQGNRIQAEARRLKMQETVKKLAALRGITLVFDTVAPK